MNASPLSRLEPAQSLADVHKTISPEPLIGAEEFEAFYRAELNQTRGTDQLDLMREGLRECKDSSLSQDRWRFFKSYLYGHRGVGKSTELTGLARAIGDEYGVIRFSVERELDPQGFQPFDVLLLIVALMSEQCEKPVSKGGAGSPPPDDLLKEIWDWFATEAVKVNRKNSLLGKLEAGAGVTGDSMWAKALALFGAFRAEIQYTGSREVEVVQYRLAFLSELVKLANRFFFECNQLLKKSSGRTWLVVGEDFDRAYIPSKLTKQLFVTYGNVFKSLETHFIFTIPVELAYASATQMTGVERYLLPDTPVYTQSHEPHAEGRAALRAVLQARVIADLFAEGQLERLIVASGGNIRDLFALTTHASRTARNRGCIEEQDVDASINAMRAEYRSQLGTTAGESESVTVDDKIRKLVAIFHGEPRSDIPDAVLHSLLRCRAVQEFNGKRWFGVHPLVVDYLASLNEITTPNQGPVPGGLI